MALSEYERRIFDEMWADLPPLRVGVAFRLRLAARRGTRHAGARLVAAAPYLGLLAVGVGMVMLAGLLFHNGYAAGTAAVSAGAIGFLLSALHRRRSRPSHLQPRRVGYLRAEREATRDE